MSDRLYIHFVRWPNLSLGDAGNSDFSNPTSGILTVPDVLCIGSRVSQNLLDRAQVLRYGRGPTGGGGGRGRDGDGGGRGRDNGSRNGRSLFGEIR